MKYFYCFLCLACIISLCRSTQPYTKDHRPNILLIVADDLGYSDLGCFGSEIATPNLDALAREGQIFTNFYTAATCSPTRAMLLTGMDHHTAGLGNMAERVISIPEQNGQPGYEGYLNDRVISVAQLLKEAGFDTYMAGKWHLGLSPDQSPMAKGFERSYSLLNGYANHFYPDPEYDLFWENDRYVEYPYGRYSTEVYTDKMIEFLESNDQRNKPFFLYAAYTAPHWPLQAPKEYIKKYEGVYDTGYDSLHHMRFTGLKKKGLIPDHTPFPGRPERRGDLYEILEDPLVPWNSLSDEEKKIESRAMEIYAAMIDNLDEQIGRLTGYLKKSGKYENTLIVFISDNGAAVGDLKAVPEDSDWNTYMGTYNSFVAYGPQWAHASSAAFRLYKGYTTEGGIHTPMIIKAPCQKEGRGILRSFTTVMDLAPTFLDLAGIDYPETYKGRKMAPWKGKTLIPYLEGDTNSVHNDDYVVGWELFGRCALRKGDWKITRIERPFGTGEFQLYNLESDPNEMVDLSDSRPEIFQELLIEWNAYVQENGVILVD